MPKADAVAPIDLNARNKVLFDWLRVNQVRWAAPPFGLGVMLALAGVPLPLAGAVAISGLPLAQLDAEGRTRAENLFRNLRFMRKTHYRVYRTAFGGITANQAAASQLEVGIADSMPLYAGRPDRGGMLLHTDGTYTVCVRGSFDNRAFLTPQEQADRKKAERVFWVQLDFDIELRERIVAHGTKGYKANITDLRRNILKIRGNDQLLKDHLEMVGELGGTAKLQECDIIIGSDPPEKMQAKLQLAARRKPEDKSIVEEVTALRTRSAQKSSKKDDLATLLIEQLQVRVENACSLLDPAGFHPKVLGTREYEATERAFWRELNTRD